VKNKWILTAVLAIIAIVVGIIIYFVFLGNSELKGVSSSGKWEATYSTKWGDKYWEGYLIKRTKKDVEVEQATLLVNGNKMGNYNKDEKDKDTGNSDKINFVWLGDAPKKNDTYEVVVEWNENEKHYKETIQLK